MPNAAGVAELRGENAELVAAVASLEGQLAALREDRGVAEGPGSTGSSAGCSGDGNEKAIRRRKLEGAAKLACRRERSVPAAEPEGAFEMVRVQRHPAGRRNWLFAWTEVGAERVGVAHVLESRVLAMDETLIGAQGPLATCTLQGVDPYTYLVDVLQRVGRHPASRAVELAPRVWRTLFADDPRRSDLDRDPPAS